MQQDPSKSGGFFSQLLHKVIGRKSAGTPPSAVVPNGEASEPADAQRRQRNDALRYQEFAALRRLRSQIHTPGAPLPTVGSSETPSILGGSDSAVNTLKKIDAIEAHMARQWWQSTQPAGPGPGVGPEGVGAPSSGTLGAVQPAGASPVPNTPTAAAVLQAPSVALQVLPVLEPACILFANGDLEGANAQLLELLATALECTPVDTVQAEEIWLALLDFYRATGDEAGFEPLAIDYATHFERSPPLWFSLPAQLGLPPLAGPHVPSASRRAFRWAAPRSLQTEAVAALSAAVENAGSPWMLSWQAIERVAPEAVPALTALLTRWADTEGTFVVEGAPQLLAVIEQHTSGAQASGRGQQGAHADESRVGDGVAQPPPWWELHMAALRWLGREPAFEQVAFDYCVAYEVSPPQWSEPMCVVEVGPQPRPAPQPVALKPANSLHGVLEGDITSTLQALQSLSAPGQVLEVPCGLLVRIDFVAVSALLNWAADMQAQGRRVRLVQLHRLVAMFLHVMGVHEHADIQVRRL